MQKERIQHPTPALKPQGKAAGQEAPFTEMAVDAAIQDEFARRIGKGDIDPAESLAYFQSNERNRAMLQFQSVQGNAYLQRVLQEARRAERSTQVRKENSLPAHTGEHQVGFRIIQRSPGTQAEHETEAAETMRRLRTIHANMLRHSNRTVRNTGRLFSSIGGRPPRLQFDAMTLRSDSASLVRAAGEDPAERAYYFYGLTQTNQHRHGPNTIGTVDADTIYVRGKNSSGDWQQEEEVMGTFSHESSHILVSSYGEHPGTDTSASSFDRYKDEFRAYWIEPVGPWSRMDPDNDKAAAIRVHLVGRRLNDTKGYPALRRKYWTNAGFKAQVDAHRRPDGYNLTNNPNLDRLFQLLRGVTPGTSTIEQVLSHIVRVMAPTERDEALRSPLIQRLYNGLVWDAPLRVYNALLFPRTTEHTRELNPTNSSNVAALLEAVTLRDEDGIKNAYRSMNAADRGQARYNAALLVYLDKHLSDSRQRAATYAMITGARLDQYDAMIEFLDACMDAQIDAALGTLTEVTANLRRTIGRLVYEARLAFYRLTENVRREFVDVLPNPVRSRLLFALREGEEP